MPLTKTGREVLRGMQKKHGEEKGKEYFYASINKGIAGSEQWHVTRKTKIKKRR